jgi:hypothetical protein
MAEELLSERWEAFRPHPVQAALWRSKARFNVIEAGRRSGKTQLAKQDAVRCLLDAKRFGWLGVLAAPTRDQAKAIFWEDLKMLVPGWAIASFSESELAIRCINGGILRVVGMDRPHRIEGVPVDKIWLDELADLKVGTWDRTIRPLLSTKGRQGSAWIFGVPRPSTQFAELARAAQDPANHPEWAYWYWTSEGVVDTAELASARATMDPLVFAQEYLAQRINFQGRAYYRLEQRVHSAHELQRDLDRTLYLCFDFNNAPGVCAAVQELPPPSEAKRLHGAKIKDIVTSAVGEVHIPRHSNSELVARKAAELWGDHRGIVELHGDASGGALRSSSVSGSDWDLITQILKRVFGGRLRRGYPNANPSVRARVNAVNARLRNADDVVGALFCARNAKRLAADVDATMVLDGTAGELDKDSDPSVTHLSDAFGYYVFMKHPCHGYRGGTSPLAL